MIAALWFACSTPSPSVPEKPQPMTFRITAATAPSPRGTQVTLKVRTPGGDLPVQKAALRDASATVDGSATPIENVVFKPGMSGCTVTFELGATGAVELAGALDLQNPDGSVWNSLELPPPGP